MRTFEEERSEKIDQAAIELQTKLLKESEKISALGSKGKLIDDDELFDVTWVLQEAEILLEAFREHLHVVEAQNGALKSMLKKRYRHSKRLPTALDEAFDGFYEALLEGSPMTTKYSL